MYVHIDMAVSVYLYNTANLLMKWRGQFYLKIYIILEKKQTWQKKIGLCTNVSPGFIFQIKGIHVTILSKGAKTEDAVPWAKGGLGAVGVTVAARRHRDRGEMGPASRLGIKFDIEMDQLWTGRDEFSWGLFIKWRPSICKWENKFIGSASHVESVLLIAYHVSASLLYLYVLGTPEYDTASSVPPLDPPMEYTVAEFFATRRFRMTPIG